MTTAIVENQGELCAVCGRYSSVTGLTMTDVTMSEMSDIIGVLTPKLIVR